MKKILIATAVFLSACQTIPSSATEPVGGTPTQNNSSFISYQPIMPIGEASFGTSGLTKNAETICTLDDASKKTLITTTLPHTSLFSYNYIRKNGTAALTFASAGAEVNKGDTVIQAFDYIRYNTVILPDGRSALSGVGYRAEFRYTVKGKKFNLGNLFNIGLKASSSELSGSMAVHVMGISGEVIDTIMPGTPSNITPDRIEGLFEKLGEIKSKIYANGVAICPSIVSVSGATQVEKAY